MLTLGSGWPAGQITFFRALSQGTDVVLTDR